MLQIQCVNPHQSRSRNTLFGWFIKLVLINIVHWLVCTKPQIFMFVMPFISEWLLYNFTCNMLLWWRQTPPGRRCPTALAGPATRCPRWQPSPESPRLSSCGKRRWRSPGSSGGWGWTYPHRRHPRSPPAQSEYLQYLQYLNIELIRKCNTFRVKYCSNLTCAHAK